jgi:hypothetical protein
MVEFMQQHAKLPGIRHVKSPLGDISFEVQTGSSCYRLSMAISLHNSVLATHATLGNGAVFARLVLQARRGRGNSEPGVDFT